MRPASLASTDDATHSASRAYLASLASRPSATSLYSLRPTSEAVAQRQTLDEAARSASRAYLASLTSRASPASLASVQYCELTTIDATSETTSTSHSAASAGSSEMGDDDDAASDSARPTPTPTLGSSSRWLVDRRESASSMSSMSSTSSSSLDKEAVQRWPLDAVQQLVATCCVLSSVVTLCGLDLTTSAQLLMALLALACVFFDLY